MSAIFSILRVAHHCHGVNGMYILHMLLKLSAFAPNHLASRTTLQTHSNIPLYLPSTIAWCCCSPSKTDWLRERGAWRRGCVWRTVVRRAIIASLWISFSLLHGRVWEESFEENASRSRPSSPQHFRNEIRKVPLQQLFCRITPQLIVMTLLDFLSHQIIEYTPTSDKSRSQQP
jgi:hypothetical protein